MESSKPLPPDTNWLFPEYSFSSLDEELHQGVIIERILERGSWSQLQWLFSRYGETRVTEWVQLHGFRLLSKRSFALWKLTLDITSYHAPTWAKKSKAMSILW